MAIGWVANTSELELSKAGVEINARGFIGVDEFLRNKRCEHICCGDVTGRLMLVPQAIQDGFMAATNAVQAVQR